jgi:hypothetical protein
LLPLLHTIAFKLKASSAAGKGKDLAMVLLSNKTLSLESS